MRQIDVDVLVVGAGPAGSIAAKYAALGGARTLLMEKRQEIGSPVRCGEGISKVWLPEVGVRPDPRWIANEVEGARLISPGGAMWTVNERDAGNEVGYVIERALFDKALAADAARAGAEIMLRGAARGVIREGGRVAGVHGTSMEESVEIRAPIVIGADGFESQLGRWAGIDTRLKLRDVDSCLQYRLAGIDCDRRFCDFYLGSVAPGGYVWVFPKSGDVANVGIGVQLSKLGSPGEVKGYLDRFIASRPELAKGGPVEIVAGGVSICAPLKRTVADGVMLVGDAARLIDPVTGGGIANGCISGKLAAEVALEALEARDTSAAFLQRYERAWRKRLEPTLLRNWMAKERLVALSDEALDRLIAVLSESGVVKLTVFNLLKAVQERCPELVREFQHLITPLAGD